LWAFLNRESKPQREQDVDVATQRIRKVGDVANEGLVAGATHQHRLDENVDGRTSYRFRRAAAL
jgi:hypothetical protein